VVRVPSFGRDGNRLHQLVIRRDLTEQRTTATKLELAGRVLDQGGDGIVICDAGHQVMMVNQAYTEINRLSADELVPGTSHQLLAEGQLDAAVRQGIWEAVHEHGRWSGEVWAAARAARSTRSG
jgi:PAS domain-containing protein